VCGEVKKINERKIKYDGSHALGENLRPSRNGGLEVELGGS
jgi:hypothetical protein